MKEKANKKMMRGMILSQAMIMVMSVIVSINVSAAAQKSFAVTMKGVEISKNKATIEKKKTTRLTVKYNGKNVTSKASYKSSNPKVVSVSRKGKITTKKKGKCVITVKYKKMSKKLKLTVTSVKNTGFPAGNYSIVAEAGGYRGSLAIDSAGIATYVEWSSGTGEGYEIKYQLVVNKKVTVPVGVTAYSLQFIKGDIFNMGDDNRKSTGYSESRDNWGLYYDANKKTLKDTRGSTWKLVE